MLVALLSSQELVADEGGQARAFLRVGGQTILSRQVEFALGAGCERIICLSSGITPELLGIQHAAESRDAVFHTVRSAINLSGLVSIADDLLVISDGLVFDDALAAAHIGPQRSVFTLPAEPAVSLGYERLDQARAWAGIMVIGGALVEKLADLPDDIDPQSSLLRLALQNGTRCLAMPDTVLSRDQWALVTRSEIAQNYESSWLQLHASVASWAAPMNRLADVAAIAVIRQQAKARFTALSGGMGALALLVAAVSAGLFGHPTIALMAVCIAAFSMRFSGSLGNILGEGAFARSAVLPRATAIILDIVLICLCVMAAPSYDQAEMAFAAVILFGLLHLIQRIRGKAWWIQLQAITGDRSMLVLILFGLSFAGIVLVFIQLLAIAVLTLILLQNYRGELTPA